MITVRMVPPVSAPNKFHANLGCPLPLLLYKRRRSTLTALSGIVLGVAGSRGAMPLWVVYFKEGGGPEQHGILQRACNLQPFPSHFWTTSCVSGGDAWCHTTLGFHLLTGVEEEGSLEWHKIAPERL